MGNFFSSWLGGRRTRQHRRRGPSVVRSPRGAAELSGPLSRSSSNTQQPTDNWPEGRREMIQQLRELKKYEDIQKQRVVATGRIKRELEECQAGTRYGIAACPVEGDNLFSWYVVMLGPKNTVWEGSRFGLIMDFPDDYPFFPPVVCFTTPVMHPNICPDTGRVYGDIFMDGGQEGAWSPAWSAATVLVGVQSLLNKPNTELIINEHAADLYEWDKISYCCRIRELVHETKTMEIPEHLERMLQS